MIHGRVMTRRLTEKTLELNVMAELAYLARRAGYRPYFIGFSQIEELARGQDTAFQAGSLVGFFQFKRGTPRRKFFTFYINNNTPHFNQHKALSIGHPACRYVFPLVGSNEDVFHLRGRLLHWTAFIPPHCFDPLSPPNRPHRVRLYSDGTWKRYSEVLSGKWRNPFGQVPRETQPTDDQPSPDKAFASLQLPRLGGVLERMDVADIGELFRQRSSFAMLFAE